MKIIYLHQYFKTPEMHGGTRSYEMAIRMVNAGHEVHLITTWQDETANKGWWQEEIDGINVHWLPVKYNNKMGKAARIWAFLKFAYKAFSKAISIGGDVVFSTSTPLTISIPGVLAARKLKCPHIFEVRDLWPEVPIAMGALRDPITIWAARALERFAYRNSDYIIALSPGMAKGIVEVGYPHKNVSIIPNGCDLELFDPATKRANSLIPEAWGLKNGHPLVLYAGTFGAVNGVSYLVDLAFELKDSQPNIRFVAVGGGSDYFKVETYAHELGVLNRNFFVYPSMAKLELVDLFHAASVSVSLVIDLPELWNNSANKFFDTLASGTAIAINHQGWQADLIAENNLGIVLDPSPKSAAEQLKVFLDNRSRVNLAGHNARALAIKKFDRDILAKHLISIIEHTVESKTPTQAK